MVRPIDWRNAPWLAPLDGVDRHRRGQHDFALHILDEYEQTARPFALLLSTYRITQLYGEGADGYGEFLLGNALGGHLHDRDINMIAVQDQSNVLAHGPGISASWMKHVYPELRLGNATWLDAVRELIRRAELIIIECESLTSGVEAEVRACATLGRVDRAVVVLPVSPPYTSLDDAPLFADFTRALHGDQLDLQAPLDHFAMRDLVARASSIGLLPVEERLALRDADGFDSKFPISVADLLTGYEALAASEQKAGRKDRVAFCYSRLTQLARLSGNQQLTVLYLTQLSQARWPIGDFKGGLEALLEAEHRLERGDSQPLPFDGMVTAAQIRQLQKEVVLNPAQGFLARNETKAVFEFLTELLEPIRRWQNRALEALCLSKWAEAEIRERRFDEAFRTIENVLQIARESGDRFREAFATHLRGLAFQSQGDEDRAVEIYDDALKRLPRPGVYEMEWGIFMNIGGIVERRGDRDGARKHYEAAAALAEALSLPRLRATALSAVDRLRA